MEKSVAVNLLAETLQRPFREAQFQRLVHHLLPPLKEFQPSTPLNPSLNSLKQIYPEQVRQCYSLGQYLDPNGNPIEVVVVQLHRAIVLERARTTQRNRIAQYLQAQNPDAAALVAYYTEEIPDWRLSWVCFDDCQKEGERSSNSFNRKFVTVRRSSFLVGQTEPHRIAQHQLLPLLLNDRHPPTLHQLEAAFNPEWMTKEFFEQYKSLFLQVKQEAETRLQQGDLAESTSINPTHFAKKLLGQILFLYFLKKKEWLDVEPENLFTCSAKHCLPQIPFLQSGLFAPIDRSGRDDGQKNKTLIENGTIQKIVATFDLYNFTLREDERLDKEVAINPEMLGKVFENLLETTDRKSKGTFYTPREVVQYMCQESLITYLDTTINPVQHQKNEWNGERVPRSELSDCIRYSEPLTEHDAWTGQKDRTPIGAWQIPDSIGTHAVAIDRALASIKICDPAIGSGVFPVEMMQEIVKLRGVLTPYLPGSGRTSLTFKHHAIQSSIYGVDIDPDAVNIARLRLGLSLVADADTPEALMSLPNLNPTIVCGDALLRAEIEEYFNKVFRQQGGFDVVIGNPPYVDSETMKKTTPQLRKTYATLFQETAKGNWDLFVVFVQQGIELLKHRGVISYITPNKLIGEKYSESLRYFISQRKAVWFRDYSSIEVFKQAGVYPIVFLIENSDEKTPVQLTTMQNLNSIAFEYTVPPLMFYQDINWDIYFLPPAIVNIFIKLGKLPNVGTYFDSIFAAATVNEAYLIKNVIINGSGSIQNTAKQLINTGTLDRYRSLWLIKPTTYIKEQYLCPVVLNTDLKRISLKRFEQSNSNKIVIAGMSKTLECFYDEGLTLAGKSTTIVLGQAKDLKFLTAILNSKLVSFWFFNYFKSRKMAGGYINVNKNSLKSIPIPNWKSCQTKLAQYRVIGDLAEQMLHLNEQLNTEEQDKKNHLKIKEKIKKTDQEIDRLVYQLYELTDDEIAIVEGC